MRRSERTSEKKEPFAQNFETFPAINNGKLNTQSVFPLQKFLHLHRPDSPPFATKPLCKGAAQNSRDSTDANLRYFPGVLTIRLCLRVKQVVSFSLPAPCWPLAAGAAAQRRLHNRSSTLSLCNRRGSSSSPHPAFQTPPPTSLPPWRSAATIHITSSVTFLSK